MKTRTFRYFIVLISILAAFNFSCKKNNSSSTPPKSNVDLKKGLLLYLPFSGNISDSSGNNNFVQQTGGTVLTADKHGNPNSAFSGSSGRLLVINNGSIQFDTAFTLSFNFLIQNIAYQAFLSMVNNTTGHGPTFLLGTNLQGNTNFSFSVQGKNASCNDFGRTDLSNNDTTQFTPQTGTWYNATCIYHKGDIQTYINGNLISTHPFPGSTALLCPNAKFIVGGWWDADPLTLNGKLDEIRLYNRVLNADEINQLYKNFQ